MFQNEKSCFSFNSMNDYVVAIFSEPGKFTVELKRGLYKVECWGAQGGIGNENGDFTTQGGKGAYTSGQLKVTEDLSLYCFVGGKGGNGSPDPQISAIGGFNGGGNGGVDTRDNDGSGAGGGASDIRFVDGDWNNLDSLESRIMVAAGGSGSAFNSYGAPGGAIYGLLKSERGIDDIIENTDTSQDKGFMPGCGESGKNHEYTPSSGAGGGFYGGNAKEGIESPTYLAVSSSGSSYISGHSDCVQRKYVFTNTEMIPGSEYSPSPTQGKEKGHSGNGFILITMLNLSCKRTCISHRNVVSYICLLLTIYS